MIACFHRPHSSNCVFQKPLSHVHTHTVPLPPQHHPHIPDFYHLIHMQCQKMMFLVLSLTAMALPLWTCMHIALVTMQFCIHAVFEPCSALLYCNYLNVTEAYFMHFPYCCYFLNCSVQMPVWMEGEVARKVT